jgi:MFS family permease
MALDNTTTAPRITVSIETLAYALLIVLALALRIALLDGAPLDGTESHEALAGLNRIDPNAPTADEDIIPLNALGAAFNVVLMTLVGTSDTSARLATALAGLLLTFSPLLFRRYLGRLAALLMVIGLLMSPVLLLAARSMSGVVWSMLLAMIGGWCLLRFAETKSRGFALAASVSVAGVLLLTSPLGVLIVLGLFAGFVWARIQADEGESRPVFWADFPLIEAIVAAMVGLAVIATFFFTAPDGLSSLARVPEAFFNGMTARPENTPFGFGLLVALRYEFPLLMFGIAGALVASRTATFLERFLTGWLAFSLLAVTLYPGTSADGALLLTMPALGLTVSLSLRLAESAGYGYWRVPGWVLPLHTLIVAALFMSMGLNLQSGFNKLFNEARPNEFAEVLEIGVTDVNSTRIGEILPGGIINSMVVTLPLTYLLDCQPEPGDRDLLTLTQDSEGRYCVRDVHSDFTIQVVPIESASLPAELVISSPDGNQVFGPRLVDGTLQIFFSTALEGEYRLNLRRQSDDPGTEPIQYLLTIAEGDLNSQSIGDEIAQGDFRYRVPRLNAIFLVMSRNPNPVALLVILLMLLAIPITFFVNGAFYGARVAIRGLIFGLLVYMMLFGLSMGWGAATVHAGDLRELWYRQSTPEDYRTVQDVLTQMSRRDNGTDNLIPITVLGEADSSLGWALRGFPNTRFVSQLGPDVTTPAVLAPDVTPRPTLGADYVGQRLIFGYDWSLGWLNWTDFGAWMFSRKTWRDPVVSDPWRLWIVKEVYDVETIPGG